MAVRLVGLLVLIAVGVAGLPGSAAAKPKPQPKPQVCGGSANSGNCCDINHSGGDWSEAFPISYPKPDPGDFIVPPSRDVMLP